MLKALQQAEPVLGPLHHVAQCPALKINFEEPIAQVYQQMAIAGMRVLTYKYKRPKSRAIFLLRGLSAVEAFDRELRNVTR
ncbi:MAG: hypothetical protein NTY53_19405 [Kiritimatiellaeota bacterium]|nr:hypothetical protein [Kiritimatiellota bacterium]